MVRSISIDPLALHNIVVSEDHFVIRHDSITSDKEEDKIHNIAVHYNRMDHILCPGVSLGVWLALNQNTFRYTIDHQHQQRDDAAPSSSDDEDNEQSGTAW